LQPSNSFLDTSRPAQIEEMEETDDSSRLPIASAD